MKAFAEIIQSSLDGWIGQSWQWDAFPTFGSIMVVEQGKRTIFGIVHQVTTGSMDPNRYPFPYQKTEEELKNEQPQIFEFLKTSFSCAIIGFKENGAIRYQKAPEPPKIHAFIKPASKELLQEFLSDDRYLHALFSTASTINNFDELLLALVRTIEQAGLLSDHKMNSFIDHFALLIGNDYRRLKLFLQRM